MKKIFFIILLNIVLIVLFLFIAELTVWYCENQRIIISGESNTENKIIPFHPKPKLFFVDTNYFPQPEFGWGRNPDGLQYKKKPIVIFGCSFAYGFTLKDNETVSYKLSELTKRPVYNRASTGWSIQHMLCQVRQKKFYEKVPEPEFVLYFLINDHFRRLYVPTFMSTQMLAENYNLRYKLENGKLVLKDRQNKIKDFFRQSYILQKLEHAYINNYTVAHNNYDNYSTFALEHFIESREAMQKHWKNTEYIVVLYGHFFNDEKFKELLEQNGFKVILLQDFSEKDLLSGEYMQNNYHPSAKAWEELTPVIAEKAKLY